jgi:hypothetical protein
MRPPESADEIHVRQQGKRMLSIEATIPDQEKLSLAEKSLRHGQASMRPSQVNFWSAQQLLSTVCITDWIVSFSGDFQRSFRRP